MNTDGTALVHNAPLMQSVWQNLPHALTSLPRWAVAGDNKIPLTYDTVKKKLTAVSIHDTHKLFTFNEACDCACFYNREIGFVVTRGDNITCIDCDITDASKPNSMPSLHTTQERAEEYAALLEATKSYAELSLSGKGLHIWVYGDTGKGRRGKGMEIYPNERFIVCTGNHVSKIKYYKTPEGLILPEILEREKRAVIDANRVVNLLADTLRANENIKKANLIELPQTEDDSVLWERAKNAVNSDLFLQLCEGDWQNNYCSQSEADFALLSMLTFYSPSNSQVIRMFLKTGLGQRKKAHAKNNDYLKRTIGNIRAREKRDADATANIDLQAMMYKLNASYEQMKNDRGLLPASGNENKRLCVRSEDELFQMPPMQWIVKNLLPAEGLAAVYGRSGSGKSFLILYLLWCLSNGKPFFDHKCKRVDTAYVYFEGGGGIPQRVKAQNMKHGCAPIKYVDAGGLNLTEEGSTTELIEALRPHLGAGNVVCIDTLAASSAGMDENSVRDMGLLIGELKKIQKELGGLILVVHHTGKSDDQSLRGSSALIGALDASIYVDHKKHSKERYWTAKKLKDAGDEGKKSQFNLKPIFIQTDEDGEDVFMAAVEPIIINESEAKRSQQQDNDQIDDYLVEHINNELELGNLPSQNSIEGKKGTMDFKRLPKKKELTQAEIRHSINRLISDHRIEKTGSGKNSHFQTDTWMNKADEHNDTEQDLNFNFLE